MRKEAKQEVRANVQTMNAYHSRYTGYSVQRANDFPGGPKLFNSDRAKPIDEVPVIKGLAIEFELASALTQDGDILATILYPEMNGLFPDNFWKFESDCTVDIECVSQIGTKAFWRNYYSKMKALYTYLHTIKTFPNGRPGVSCGMHVNISIANFGDTPEKQRDNIMKLHNFINRDSASYKFACCLFNRRLDQTDWCGKMRPDYLDDSGSHSYCMNYAHMREGTASRVEVRLVGAQQTFGAWRNTMECVFWMVQQTKRLSAEDWKNPVKLFKGCNQYVYDRLKSICFDNGCISSAQLEAIRETVVREELV